MISLYLSGFIILILCVVVWLAMRTGRSDVKKDMAEKNAEIKDKQLEAALNPPDKRTVIDRLRDGKF